MQEILSYPSAERNGAPIQTQLDALLRPGMRVLEIASGAGNHVERFATAWPQVHWQPSEPAAEPRRSVDARVAQARLANVAPALALDVTASWPKERFDLVLCVNMVHISPWEATEALLVGAAQVLHAGGTLFLYGPYKIGGQHTAPSNREFDADLRRRNPQWGIRDVEALVEFGQSVGLVGQAPIPLPANNFCLLFKRRERSTEQAQPIL